MHDELDRTEPISRTKTGASEDRPRIDASDDRPLRLARGTRHEIEREAPLAPRPLTTIPWFETAPAPRLDPEDLVDEPAAGIAPLRFDDVVVTARIDPPTTAPVAARTSTRSMTAPPLPNRQSRASIPPPFRAPTASHQAVAPAPHTASHHALPAAPPPLPRVVTASMPAPMFTTSAPPVPTGMNGTPPFAGTSGMFAPPRIAAQMPGAFPVVAQPAPAFPPHAPAFQPLAPAFQPPATSSMFAIAPAVDAIPEIDVEFDRGSYGTGSAPVVRSNTGRGVAMLLGAVAITALLAVAITLSVTGRNEPTTQPTVAASPVANVAPTTATAPTTAAAPTTAPAPTTAAAPMTVAVATPADVASPEPTVAAAAAPASAPEEAPAPVAATEPTARPHHHHHDATRTNTTTAMATTASKPTAKHGKRASGSLADPFATTPTSSKAATGHTSSTAKPVAAPKTVAMAAPAGAGILMVSTKPPCSLIIDGKATNLETPQRALRLSPGVHDITFINAPAKIRKNVSVTISASKTSKLIRDFSH